MGLRSLTLTLSMDGITVSRNFGISEDVPISSKSALVEILGDSISRGFSDKPDIIKGMLCQLLDDVEKKRR